MDSDYSRIFIDGFVEIIGDAMYFDLEAMAGSEMDTLELHEAAKLEDMAAIRVNVNAYTERVISDLLYDPGGIYLTLAEILREPIEDALQNDMWDKLRQFFVVPNVRTAASIDVDGNVMQMNTPARYIYDVIVAPELLKRDTPEYLNRLNKWQREYGGDNFYELSVHEWGEYLCLLDRAMSLGPTTIR